MIHRLSVSFALAMSLVGSAPCFGHAGIDERIESLTEQIAHDRNDADLYLKRAELHRSHDHWDEAMSDYRAAEKLLSQSKTHPELDNIPFYIGRLWQERGHPHQALPLLNAFLKEHPRHFDALLARAKALGQMGRPLAAARDMDAVILLQDPPLPDYYVEKAQYLSASGEAYRDMALATIDEGIGRIGPLVTLVHFGVETATQQGRYDRAVAYVDQLPDNLRSLPEWLARRGDILRAAGKTDEALDNYRQALAAIDRLSPRMQNRRAMLTLKARLNDLIANPSSEGTPASPTRP